MWFKKEKGPAYSIPIAQYDAEIWFSYSTPCKGGIICNCFFFKMAANNKERHNRRLFNLFHAEFIDRHCRSLVVDRKVAVGCSLVIVEL